MTKQKIVVELSTSAVVAGRSQGKACHRRRPVRLIQQFVTIVHMYSWPGPPFFVVLGALDQGREEQWRKALLHRC